ncbi:glycosyltransferase family 39 protein [Aequorivita sinensis]|uniref:glycosyltransferase family 39 protein n=1 Tax=Aequorivita sinensis TaxID=1382458 RepID=UPI00112402E2|nr:glycosyltransferase family 39 protein [Aequorivita sinensis]
MKYSLKFTKVSKKDILWLLLYIGVFIYFVFQPPIYSPDTGSYWHLDVFRYPIYPLFLRGFEFIFGNNYWTAVVAFQLLFVLGSIQVFFKNISNLLKLNFVLELLLFAILLFPIFPPLLTANNLASEGLSYPLYLLLISFAIDFLFREKTKRIYFFSAVFIALALTRGQFVIIVPIIVFLLLLKHKKNIFRKSHLKYLLLLILLPIITNTLDATYRKAVHKHFITTPFTFTNALTLPLYISEKKDSSLFENPAHKAIFLKTYKRIDSLGLLSSKVKGDYSAKYQVFHDNFPYICNQSFHNIGREYYKDENDPFKSAIDTEIAAKQMFPELLKAHFKDYISLYYTSVMHGFYSVFIFIFFVIICIYSGLKCLKKFNLENGLLFFGSLLILSNALIVAVAVHTIMRYVFYNFAMAFIIIVLLSKKLTYTR